MEGLLQKKNICIRQKNRETRISMDFRGDSCFYTLLPYRVKKMVVRLVLAWYTMYDNEFGLDVKFS